MRSLGSTPVSLPRELQGEALAIYVASCRAEGATLVEAKKNAIDFCQGCAAIEILLEDSRKDLTAFALVLSDTAGPAQKSDATSTLTLHNSSDTYSGVLVCAFAEDICKALLAACTETNMSSNAFQTHVNNVRRSLDKLRNLVYTAQDSTDLHEHLALMLAAFNALDDKQPFAKQLGDIFLCLNLLTVDGGTSMEKRFLNVWALLDKQVH